MIVINYVSRIMKKRNLIVLFLYYFQNPPLPTVMIIETQHMPADLKSSLDETINPTFPHDDIT